MGVPGTLARSRAHAWIHKGRYLARKVVSKCVHCWATAAQVQRQRMGALPPERCHPGVKPFSAICLDLLGPVVVKAMVNKRSHMKVWPLLFVCQATGAMHLEVMHDYGTEALLLQWDRFFALRGPSEGSLRPGEAVKQLTSSSNTAAFSAKEKPESWNWKELEEAGAKSGTEWEFVPAGCQLRNGLAEARVKATKQTLEHMLATAVNGENRS